VRRLSYIFSRLFCELAPAPVHSAVARIIGRSARFFCPACAQRVRRFSPLPDFYFRKLREHGSDLRLEDFETCNLQAYQCPHCGATDRDRLYALYLAKRLPQDKTAQKKFSLLDIAPSSALSRHIRRNHPIQYRTADLYMERVDDRMDITAMTYGDSRFDAFICSHVLEHVTDDLKAMTELRRVLKPTGWGIAMVPISLAISEIRESTAPLSEGERWKRFGQGDHARLYSRSGFIERLKQAGFTVFEHDASFFGREEMVRCGLSASSVLYVVERPS
jgi:SAM-dependent methyltransferase